MVSAINNLPFSVDFVVHTGDMATNSKDYQVSIDSGFAIMKKLKYPVYYVAGNHDVTEHQFKRDTAFFMSKFGKMNNVISDDKISIITLFNIEIKELSGEIIYDPLVELDSLLRKKPKNISAILFQHCPVTDDFYGNKVHPGWSAQKRSNLQQICEQNTVAAIISGHFHKDELQWIGSIPLFVSAPV